jgi:hypothetical protein
VERLACDARLDVRTQGALKHRHQVAGEAGEYICGGELGFEWATNWRLALGAGWLGVMATVIWTAASTGFTSFWRYLVVLNSMNCTQFRPI